MNRIRLGRTGLNVSEVGFGGIPMMQLEIDEAISLIRYCFDKGVTFFDTANRYGNSEVKIGRALKNVRDKVVVATKTLKRDAESASKHIRFSLKNLETDVVDIYQFHNISKPEELDRITADDGAFKAAAEARKEGKIRFIGFSSHDIVTAIKGCRTGLFDTLQIPFNFIETEPADELFAVVQDMDMGLIGMKPLGGGLLERADLCFRFLQQYPQIVPIPGIRSKEEADEILGLYEALQPLAERDLKEIERIRSELGKKFCHRCGYCMPCDQGVEILRVMEFTSFAKRLAPPTAIAIGKEGMETIEHCVECGECMERCPYDLPIPELLRENLSIYEGFVGRHSKA